MIEQPKGLKQAITRVALDLGRECGEGGLTMRAIAGRMGISATALYQHFEGKSAILDQVWITGLADLARAIEAPLELRPCQDALVEMGKAYLDFAQDNPWVYDLMMCKRPPDQARFRPEDAARSHRSFSLVIDAIRRGIERGEVPQTVIPVRAALHIWASLHGMAAHLVRGHLSPAIPPVDASFDDEVVGHYLKNLAYTTTETCPPWFQRRVARD